MRRRKTRSRAYGAIRGYDGHQTLTIVNGNRASRIAPADPNPVSACRRPTGRAAEQRNGPTPGRLGKTAAFLPRSRTMVRGFRLPRSRDGALIARIPELMRASKLMPASLVAAAVLALALQPVAAVPLPKPRPAGAPASAAAKPATKPPGGKADAKSSAPRPTPAARLAAAPSEPIS